MCLRKKSYQSIFSTSSSGVLVPLHGLSILLLSTDRIDPEFGCKSRIIIYLVLPIFFSNTAFFTFVFRTVLIRFAHRGLVLEGRPNLKLFDQLFWVILVPYCSIGIMMAPLVSILRGRFHVFFDYKVCLFKSIEDHDLWRKDIMPLFIPFLVWTWCQYLKLKTNRYLNKICPQQKMSSIGKFRRNFTTFEQTMQFIQVNFFCVIFYRGFLFSLFQTFSLRPETNCLITTQAEYLYIDIFHGTILPMVMEIPSIKSMRRKKHPKFFVRRSKFLEPRRPVMSEEYIIRRSTDRSSDRSTDRSTDRSIIIPDATDRSNIISDSIVSIDI